MRGSGMVLAFCIGACDGGGGSGRPDISTAPYEATCAPATGCPSPYVCTFDGPPSGPSTQRCFVPCTADDDCPDGFFCVLPGGSGNGGNVPLDYCYEGSTP